MLCFKQVLLTKVTLQNRFPVWGKLCCTTVQISNSWTSRPDVYLCLVVQPPMDIMSRNKHINNSHSLRFLARFSCEPGHLQYLWKFMRLFWNPTAVEVAKHMVDYLNHKVHDVCENPILLDLKPLLQKVIAISLDSARYVLYGILWHVLFWHHVKQQLLT